MCQSRSALLGSLLGCRDLTFLQQHDTSEPIVKVPEIHAAHAPLVVQIAINIEGVIGPDLHLADTLARDCALASALAASRAYAAGAALIEWGVKLVGPRRAVAVAIAVVVAQEVVAAGLLAAADGEGLVDGGEEILGQVGGERDDGVEVVGCVFGVQPPEEVAG